MAVTIGEYYNKTIKKKTYSYEIDLMIQSKRVRERKRGFTTKTEAKNAGKTRELELKKKSKDGHDINDLITKNKDTLLLREFFDLWLNSKETTITITGLKFYKNCCNMVVKNIGNIKLNKIKTENIELFINNLKKSGVSTQTIRHYYNTMKRAYDWGLDRNYISISPFNKLKTPKVIKKEMLVYTDIQVAKMLDAIRDTNVFIPVMIAVTTGMRRGEICGLTWDCINLEEGYLEVKQQLKVINKRIKLIPNLKTNKSKRRIELLDITIKELKILKKRQKENKLYFGQDYEGDYVVCKNNGTPYSPDYITENWTRLMKKDDLYKKIDVPLIRFHDLRHTHATSLFKLGTNPKIVAERLGHSNVLVTLNTYSHVLPTMQKEAVQKLNKFFG